MQNAPLPKTNNTNDPSPMRKRWEKSQKDAEEQKQAYYAQLTTWEQFWEAGAPGN